MRQNRSTTGTPDTWGLTTTVAPDRGRARRCVPLMIVVVGAIISTSVAGAVTVAADRGGRVVSGHGNLAAGSPDGNGRGSISQAPLHTTMPTSQTPTAHLSGSHDSDPVPSGKQPTSTPSSPASSAVSSAPATSAGSSGSSGSPAIPAASAAMLHDSLVHLDVDYGGPARDYQNHCTAEKVTIDDHTYVMSAAHCLDIAHDHYLSGAPARIATTLTDLSFAVDVSKTDGATDSPFFPATSIVESQTADVALFRIDDSGPDRHLFDRVPAIAIERYLATDSARPGQNTLSSSYESYASGRVDTHGVFLGRATGAMSDWPRSRDDIVGLTHTGSTSTTQQDACLFGGSGSLAVLANGQLTGPASGRDRKGPYADVKHVPGDYTPAESQIDRNYLAPLLDLDPHPFGTVCFYTVLTPNILGEMVALFPGE